MKLRELSNPEFVNAMSEILKIELPAKAAYWIGKAAKKVNSELKHLDETRLGILKKWALSNENGTIKVDEKNEAVFSNETQRDLFQKEFTSLLNEEIEIKQIPFSLLGEDTIIEPHLLLSLDPILLDDSGYNTTPLEVVK